MLANTPRGIRIPVASVKGKRPRPLDDGGKKLTTRPVGFEPTTSGFGNLRSTY